MSERAQFNVYLPVELVRAVKHAAVDAESSLSAYVEAVLEEHLVRAGDARSGDEEAR